MATATAMSDRLRVAILWRGDEQARARGLASNERLRPIVVAFEARGVDVSLVIYYDAIADQARAELADVDAVLVWVDPIGGGGDRSRLDPLLREVAIRGVVVSAHPDVILAMGTKDVLVDTRHVGWGSDTDRYGTFDELAARFPERLGVRQRVLKQHRGNGGTGVFRVELVGPERVRVQHAEIRDTTSEELPLAVLLDRCRDYLAVGPLIDQPFQPRVSEGLIRAYHVVDRLVGFARQSSAGIDSDDPARVMGLPSPKTMFPADAPEFSRLRRLLESDWIPAMQATLGIDRDDLPLLWDADFLLGEHAEDGSDTYVLCEINVSSITPFPPDAVEPLVDAAIERITRRRSVRECGAD